MELEQRLGAAGAHRRQAPAANRQLGGAFVAQPQEATVRADLDDFDVALGRRADRILGLVALLRLVRLDERALALQATKVGRGATGGAIEGRGHLGGGGRRRGRLDVEALFFAAEQLVVGGDLQVEGDLSGQRNWIYSQMNHFYYDR